jgi:hypothetical protein
LGPLVRGKDHHHVAAVEAGHRLDSPDGSDVVGDLVEDVLAELRPLNFASSEHDRDLHLVTLGQESGHLAGLGVEVTWSYLQAVLHLLEADVGGLPPGLPSPLGFVELELAVVHDPAHRRRRLGCHFDEVEVQVPGDGKGFWQRLDAKLRAFRIDQANLPSADPFVDPMLVSRGGGGYSASLLI